jgi:hypothetical protein
VLSIHLTAGQAHESRALAPVMARRLLKRREGVRLWPLKLAWFSATKSDPHRRANRTHQSSEVHVVGPDHPALSFWS